MQITKYLDNMHAQYKVSHHHPTFSSQRLASEEHIGGHNVMKPVLIIADGTTYMCVLAACDKIDFGALKRELGVEEVGLADELVMARVFEDCELGAEPPFGSFYGLTTLMDEKLNSDEYVLFQSGSHEEAVRMELEDYKRIERPRICSFSYSTG
jgi:Ala-tRNA(Pro) deacylase